VPIGYLRNNWDALKRFLSDPQLPIDNNECERALRRIAVGRKNWLFVGSEKDGEGIRTRRREDWDRPADDASRPTT
jgi:hypothetical protein